MIMCCGKVRTSPFCPECGKPIGDDYPLAQILGHIQSYIHTLEGCHERRKAYRPGRAEPKALEKWRRWEKAMQEVIQKNNV